MIQARALETFRSTAYCIPCRSERRNVPRTRAVPRFGRGTRVASRSLAHFGRGRRDREGFMFVSHLAARAVQLDEAAFAAAYPSPALVFEGFGRWITDHTPLADELWAKTDHGQPFLRGKTVARRTPPPTFEI